MSMSLLMDSNIFRQSEKVFTPSIRSSSFLAVVDSTSAPATIRTFSCLDMD